VGVGVDPETIVGVVDLAKTVDVDPEPNVVAAA
jgi:hypothetical protein